MDEQRPLSPPEDLYTQVSKDALGNNERLGAVATAAATAAEAFVSVAAPVRQQREDTNAIEPVVEHRTSLNVPTEQRFLDHPCGRCHRLKINCSRIWPCESCHESGTDCVPYVRPFRYHSNTFRTKVHRVDRACERCHRRKVKCSRIWPCEACQRSRSTCVPQSDRQSVNHRTMMSTEPLTEKSPVSCVYPDQPSSDTSRTYEAHTSASMEGHRWSVSGMGRASDVAIPKDGGAERGSSTTCPADVTARGEGNEIRDDRNSTLPSDIGDNVGWAPSSNANALPDSYMPADNSMGGPMADPGHWMPWAMEPRSWETLPASFWGWTWSQSGYLTGSETDGSLHPSIPASQAAGWPFGGEAEQPEYPSRSGVIPFLGDYSQELYPPGPSFDAPDPIPSSNALGLSSILETAPPSFPRFPHVQHVGEASLARPTESPMLMPPWDPLAPVSAALPKTDVHRHSLHQQPSAPIPVRNTDPTVPRWLRTMMDYQEAEVRPFDNFGANSLDLSRNVTMPEDQVEYRHAT